MTEKFCTSRNNEEKILYEEIELKDLVKEKFGKHEHEPKDFKKANDMNWVLKNGGFGIYSDEEAFFLRIDSENRRVLPLIKINLQINKSQMTITQICGSPDNNTIVIAFMKNADTLFIVWDVKNNRESYNFSTSKSWSFIHGPKSKAGFLLNEDTYSNLDTRLMNYFFEYTFSNQALNQQKVGYRINTT
jgi:hypothetical protein